MKNILAFCILYLVTILAYAETCPLAPKGYVFRVGAWGDHVSTQDAVRCHYYSPDYTKHIEIRTGWVDESAFINHPQWISTSDHYYLCTSHATDVRDCPFR